ncbi:hypothetical protein SESBI_50446, partial [Sesbania bispinosa]
MHFDGGVSRSTILGSRSEEALVEVKVNEMVANESKNEGLDNHSSDMEKEQKERNGEVSDTETVKDFSIIPRAWEFSTQGCTHLLDAFLGSIYMLVSIGPKQASNDCQEYCFCLIWLLSLVVNFLVVKYHVLREIISKAFGNSCQVSPLMRLAESNGAGKRNDGKSTALKWKGNLNGSQCGG